MKREYQNHKKRKNSWPSGSNETMATMIDVRHQAITGVVPPQTAEAMIREVWPSVTIYSGVATLGEKLIRSIVLAPLGWILMLPVYFLKVMPFIARRYTLTNRRIM